MYRSVRFRLYIKVRGILLGISVSKINSIESYRQCNSNLINVNALRILIGIEGNTIASKEVRSKAIRWYGCTKWNELDARNGTLQGILKGIWIGGVHPILAKSPCAYLQK